MTPNQLKAFMTKHNFTHISFALFIGVTSVAVRHWLLGKRSISLPVSRVLKLLDKHPELIKEFGNS